MTKMNAKEANGLALSVKEVAKNHLQMHSDAKQSIKKTTNSASPINKLYKSGNKNYLIKAGMALIVFPEPVISDVLGTTLLAAGAIQEGIRRQSIFLDDLPKAFKSAMRDLQASKDLI
jgi:hypothetical protein